MRRVVLASVTALAFIVPAAAAAKPPTHRHFGVYRYVYRHAVKQFGHHLAGCELVFTCKAHPVTDAMVVASMHTLERMLHPRPAFHATAGAPYSSGPMSSLESCIIRKESGGNPLAVNGQYHGIGQWSPSSWMRFSHGRFGSDPLDATYAQQESVLRSEGTANMIDQQGQYDGCA